MPHSNPAIVRFAVIGRGHFAQAAILPAFTKAIDGIGCLLSRRFMTAGSWTARRPQLSFGIVWRVACPHNRPVRTVFMAQDARYRPLPRLQ